MADFRKVLAAWIVVTRDMTNVALPMLLGGIVGLCLGLAGGGGSVFAVPLLVYGVGLPAHQAVCVSMVAVAVTAGIAAVKKLRAKQSDVPAACIVAMGGLVGAPTGAFFGKRFPSEDLLILFGGVVLLVAAQMLRRSFRSKVQATPSGRKRNTAHALFLTVAGMLSGTLSGLLGIGSGFVIVPALVTWAAMTMHRAIATSLLATTVIGVVATASHLVAGQAIPVAMTFVFLVGSVLGYLAGDRLRGALQAKALQKVFSIVMMGMAAVVILRNVSW